MPYCPACGSEIAGANFCPYCGKPTGFSVGPDASGGTPPEEQRSPAQQFYPPPPPAYSPYPPPRPGAVSRTTSAVPARRLFACAGVGVVSMCAVAAASFLPWVSYSGINIKGYNRDGKIILVLSVLGIVSAMMAAVLKSRWPFPVLIVSGIAVVSITLADIVNVTRTAGLSPSNVGIGLYLGVVAGVAAVVAGAAGSALQPSAPASAPSSG